MGCKGGTFENLGSDEEFLSHPDLTTCVQTGPSLPIRSPVARRGRSQRGGSNGRVRSLAGGLQVVQPPHRRRGASLRPRQRALGHSLLPWRIRPDRGDLPVLRGPHRRARHRRRDGVADRLRVLADVGILGRKGHAANLCCSDDKSLPRRRWTEAFGASAKHSELPSSCLWIDIHYLRFVVSWLPEACKATQGEQKKAVSRMWSREVKTWGYSLVKSSILLGSVHSL